MDHSDFELIDWCRAQLGEKFSVGGERMPEGPVSVNAVRQAMKLGILDQFFPTSGGSPLGPASGARK